VIRRLREAVRHPFWQAIGLLVAAFILFRFGIAYLPPVVGVRSAPVPQSVLMQYMLTALIAVLIYVSENEARWRRFKEPLAALLVDGDKRWLRASLLVLIPGVVGFVTYDRVRQRVPSPAALRSIHPAPPAEITFRGRTIRLTGLENPLRSGGGTDALDTGRRVYYQNCLPCHGDRLDGEGHFGHGFAPTPLSFADPGTIAQLTESFVFWRVAKGGPGLPREGTPWNSAMPAWEDILTEEEIWSVILFLYEQGGWEPRRWETGGAEGGHE
jgi:mono/diheme cytochrome c family protein